MPVQPITWQSSAAQTASSAGGVQTLTTATMAIVYLSVTSVSGTAPTLGVWMEGSFDQVLWFEIPCDLSLVNTGTGAQVTGVANKRNINGDTLLAAAAECTGIYKHLPAQYARIAWAIGGSSTPTFTFSVTGHVK